MDGNDRVMVKVGTADDDVLPLSRAERVLQLLMERDPELFAYLLGQAMTGAEPRRPRRRP
jgi:hypothetical protein